MTVRLKVQMEYKLGTYSLESHCDSKCVDRLDGRQNREDRVPYESARGGRHAGRRRVGGHAGATIDEGGRPRGIETVVVRGKVVHGAQARGLPLGVAGEGGRTQPRAPERQVIRASRSRRTVP